MPKTDKPINNKYFVRMHDGRLLNLRDYCALMDINPDKIHTRICKWGLVNKALKRVIFNHTDRVLFPGKLPSGPQPTRVRE